MIFRIGLFTFCFLFTIVQFDEASAKSKTEFGELQRVIITFTEEINETVIEEAGGAIKYTYESVPTVSITISETGLQKLENHPQISKIENDLMVRTSVQLQDWGIQSINAPLAWETGYTGKGVKVAVIDTGISPHQDLIIAGGKSFVDYTTSYYDDNGHGTHVAGIIGARDNGFGIKGVSAEAELYAIKSINQDGSSYLSNIIAGIDWAIANKMDIINLSFGTQVDSFTFQSIVDKAYKHGIILVASAGNDGTGLGDTVDYPARYPSVISVGATDQQNGHASFSSTGPSVEVVAPGVSILSTHMNSTYIRMNGTSMASPFVAGHLALLKQAYPGLTNVQLRSILVANTIDLGAPGFDPLYGYGLIQATSYTRPLFSVPATANLAVELKLNMLTLQAMPGETHQLTAQVRLRDGTIMDITNEATWTSSNELIASVLKGKVHSNSLGRVTIFASYGGLIIPAIIDIGSIDIGSNTVTNLKDFSDVNSSFWAYKEITQLRNKQIISGYQDNTFKPNMSVRRDHVAVLFSRSITLNKTYEFRQFLDVPQSYIFFEEIKKTQQAGIFSGSGGLFKPQQNLTRAEMAKILVLAFNLQGTGEHPFKDITDKHWANEYIRILYVNGITLGADGKYMPDDFVTRAQYSVFLSRAFRFPIE